MYKVMILGIDGMDADLIKKYESELPNLRAIRESAQRIRFHSVFPPDSPMAWTSIYTGQNPAEHGVISFKDPQTASKAGEYLGSTISGKTFWDSAGRQGKKVCVVFPHMGYPVWEVPGVMVGRTNEVDLREFDIQISPKELEQQYDLSHLEPLTSYPLDIGDMIEPTKQLILREIALGEQLFRTVDWDLFFMYFSSLDNIEHLFWMYCDENDPEYEVDNPYRTVIREFYRFYDEQVIGRFLSLKDPQTVLIILSDHGHAMRPSKVVNINELLRKNGLLRAKFGEEVSHSTPYFLLDYGRKKLVSTVNKSRMAGMMASRFLKIFPKGLSAYTRSIPISWGGTRAFVSDPSGGLKAYSYAGVKIQSSGMDVDEYREIQYRVMSLLRDLRDPADNTPIVEWVKNREEVYTGEYLNKYPDILFKLKDTWGVGWDINVPLFGKSLSHRLHSGNHKQDSAVFLMYGAPEIQLKDPMNLMDVSPVLHQILEIGESDDSLSSPAE